MLVNITAPAQDYLAELLAGQDDDVLGIRIFIVSPGTAKAETCIAFCRQEDIEDGDQQQSYDKLVAWFDGHSVDFLEDSLIDYAKERMGGQLTIKAPNAKMPKVKDDSPLEDKINYLIYYEINPMLAAHGGDVSLVAVTPDKVALLNFGGGCQGCASVELTLKQSVETVLLEKLPELTAVMDKTDHSDSTHAYFR